jgi:hypothetical protein
MSTWASSPWTGSGRATAPAPRVGGGGERLADVSSIEALQVELDGQLREQLHERRAPPSELRRQTLPHQLVLQREHEQRLVDPHDVGRLRLGHPRDHRAHASLGGPGAVDELLERLDPIPSRVHDERQGELAFVLEVIVAHAVRDARELGHATRRESVGPLLPQDPSRGLEDPGPGLRGLRRAGGRGGGLGHRAIMPEGGTGDHANDPKGPW